MITALAGGVGASKFLDGLSRVAPPEEISIIVNTGDDIEMFGLYIAPDLDIVTYTLAGAVNTETGRWFNLGDRDLAAHIFRAQQLRLGLPLSEIAEMLRTALGVKSRILPMTDTHTPTTIITAEGEMHFQEYLVKRRAQPKVTGVRFEYIESAKPAPGVAEAILSSDAIIICPSNPLISIGPILAVPGMRDLLERAEAPVVAISPIVGGASLKGPTDRMLADLGMQVSAAQVARLYSDIADVFILDVLDESARSEIENLGLKVCVTDTVMSGLEEKIRLAKFTLEAAIGHSS